MIETNKIKKDLHHYLVLRDLDLIPFQLEPKHYHSVILSGNVDRLSTIQWPDHFALDSPKTNKGRSNLLLDEMIWHYRGDVRFSHTINYAIQSGSLEMVQYVHSLGYPITLSNLITAIRQAPVSILRWLITQYTHHIPRYIALYLAPFCYVTDKQAKIEIMITRLDLSERLSLNARKKETAHLRLIEQSPVASKTAFHDLDYVMSYENLFGVNRRELARMSVLIRGGQSDASALATDLSWLYNKPVPRSPSLPILLELISYGSVGKICYLKKHNLLPNDPSLGATALMLNDPNLIKLLPCSHPQLVHVLLSKNRELILKHIQAPQTRDEAHALCHLPLDIIRCFPLDQVRGYMRQYALERDLQTVLDEASDTVQDP